MKPRIVVIIATILLIFILINFYIGWHGWLFASHVLNLQHSVIYWILFYFVAFSYVIARLTRSYATKPVSYLLKLIGSYWIGIIVYALVLLPIADIMALLLYAASVKTAVFTVVLGYAVLMILIIIFVRGSWNARNPIIRKYEITIFKEANSLEQLRIAAASDLHLSSIGGTKQLKRFVEQMNSLNPDLILLPGDIIDDDIEPFIRQGMGEILGKLKSRWGVYAILGNHEYISGHIKQFVEEMNRIGIEVLMDRSVKIADSFYVIGRKDLSAGRFGANGRMELDHLLEGIDKSYPLILMDHQPYHLDKAVSNGVDVMLSGHTHRGQMAPVHWITKRLFELDWGYLKKDNLHAIVSSGFGTWGPPIRIGSRSEIIELVIHFEKEG